MKTEPMEALKFLYSVEDPTDNIPMHLTPKDKADHVCRLAFKEGQSNPKIKQLEWVKYNNELYRSKSMSVFFSYEIEKLSADWRLKVLLCQREYDILDRFNFLEEAKTYAQKHFETRIKKCLTTE